MRAAYPSLSANRHPWVIMGYHGTAWTSTARCKNLGDMQFPPLPACSGQESAHPNFWEDWSWGHVGPRFVLVLFRIWQKRQTVCKPGSVPSAKSQAGMAIPLGRPSPNASCDRPERRRGDPPGIPGVQGCLPLLLGLAPGGVFPAAAVAGGAVRSYRTVSPLPPVRPRPERSGGVLSVALSLGLPPPGVTRHRASVEPGLSSLRDWRRAAIRPSDGEIIWHHLGKCQNLKKAGVER